MTSKKSSRGGLLALACGLLLAAFISFVFVNASLAQAPTPAPAAPAAAAAAEAAPPACDGTAKPPVLEKCTPNSGDTAWMLTSMALVLMMTVPGLGLFYGGMVRKKNVGDTVMTSFAITCLVTVLWLIGLWATLVYAPIAHWVWGPDGFLNSANSDAWVHVLDFAGGTVVHVNSGTAGLMACLVLGKRKDTGPGHNMVLTFIGASLLWVGWFGFNAGSAVAANMQAGMAMTVTQVATATAALTWMFVEWALRGKPTVIGICTGAVAGLVAITPASGFVGPVGSLVIGVAAGVICYWGCTGLKHMLGYDDALDAFSVHAVGGIVGALLTGVFAVEQYGGTAGLLEGNPGQLLNQVKGIVILFVYDAVVSLIILKVIDIFIGLRVTDEVEREGLDL